MSVYRLSPISTTLGGRRWRTSCVSDVVWILAETPGEARERVASATVEFSRPTGRFAPMVQSPWLDETLALCVLDTSKTDVPYGVVIAADGRQFPIPSLYVESPSPKP
jgi:hypothetical protein